jgi:hypothetical protein
MDIFAAEVPPAAKISIAAVSSVLKVFRFSSEGSRLRV